MLSRFTFKIICSVMHTHINLFPVFICTSRFSFSMYCIFPRYCLCCVQASQKTRSGEEHISQGSLCSFPYVLLFWTSNYQRRPFYGKIAVMLFFFLLNTDRWVQRMLLFLSSEKHSCDSLWQMPPAPLIFWFSQQVLRINRLKMNSEKSIAL